MIPNISIIKFGMVITLITLRLSSLGDLGRLIFLLAGVIMGVVVVIVKQLRDGSKTPTGGGGLVNSWDEGHRF